MEINSIIYLLSPAEIYNKQVPNSVQILKGTIVQILQDKVILKIDLGNGESLIKEVTEPYYTTPHEAMQNIEPYLNPKVKMLKEEEYKGDNFTTYNSAEIKEPTY